MTMCDILCFLLLITSQLTPVQNSWIIEQIPRRGYRTSLPYAAARVDNSGIWKYKEVVRNIYTNTIEKVKTKKTSEGTGGSKSCGIMKTFAPNAGIPCNLGKDETPMFVYFSFDDAITSWNIRFYRLLFARERHNPNGCPIRATFFNSHENTEYKLLKELYDLGHEIGSHSVSHKGPSTWWSENATKADWLEEIVGQRKNIHTETGTRGGDPVPLMAVRGMRAPFLALGGDKQYDMLEENNFLYDASIPNNNQEPSWPFTLHNPAVMNGPICRSQYCPRRPHAIWEVVMNVYYMDESGTAGSSRPCSMVDGCRPAGSRQGALDFLKTNFHRHYDSDAKVPFGINMHAAWFAFDGYVEAMIDFLDYLLSQEDVYIIPVHKLIEWMQNPRTLEELSASDWGCATQTKQ